MKKIIGTFIIIFIFNLLVISCEPNDWEYIIAPPGPVKNLNITHTPLTNDDITIEFIYPSSSLNKYQSDSDSIRAWLYYRLAPDGDETYITEYVCNLDALTIRNETFAFLTTTEIYDFIVYTVDNEYQRSEPKVQTTTW